MPAADQPTTERGEQTRQRIVDAALELFEERGYAKTTMRAVADRAGVSLGNAYYYFGSKDHLVQGYYERMQAAHAEAARPALAGRTLLADRWVACEQAFLDVAERYHPFAGRFFAVAAEPSSPVNPFSDDSRPARDASIDIMRDVVTGARVKGDARLLTELPDLLWLAHMGLVLHWVHDGSPGQRRTRLLLRRTAPLLERLVGLSRLRPLRSSVHELLDLVADLRDGELDGSDDPDGAADAPGPAAAAPDERD
ncbi:TetR family transcriptional regulator [Angustibacter aerolatus]